MSSPNQQINFLTIDVEDWFHTTALERYVGFDQWENLESRIEANVYKLLEVLRVNQVRATFFVLGWVAEHFPALVKEISAHGHEIASHGYRHRLISALSPPEFKEYVGRSKKILEDLTGKPVLGYRATSFSVVKETIWALDIIKDSGFVYDSSIFPVSHDIYGIKDFPRFPFVHANGLIEIPPSTLHILGRNLPIAGGGYFRLYPYFLTYKGIKSINRAGFPAMIYLHPWELDPDCPQLRHTDPRTLFRQYVNLRQTKPRLEKLLQDFAFSPIQEQLTNLPLIDKQGEG
jgi:polysaccharide deacetylase family protein (PEP-CTERM system associated)